MASENPQVYYENEGQHGSYVYVTLEELVRNFIDSYTGDGSLLGTPRRSKIISHFKQGIKKFSINALQEAKAVELELGDTLDIILPPDYVNYVRISYVNPETGELMILSKNPFSPQATAYLQDHDADILFDEDGFVLEGTTFFSQMNDKITQRNVVNCIENLSSDINFQLDPTKNANGTFSIDTRQGKIHFSSDNASRVIMLEYLSDGLEYSNEADIKVSKLAEEALYKYVNHNLLFPMALVPLYEKKEAQKAWEAAYKNAKIDLMDIRIPEIMLCLNAKRKWIR